MSMGAIIAHIQQKNMRAFFIGGLWSFAGKQVADVEEDFKQQPISLNRTPRRLTVAHFPHRCLFYLLSCPHTLSPMNSSNCLREAVRA